MDMFDPLLEIKLPKIKDTGYKVTSPETEDYNCIAWTIGRTDIRLWPGPKSSWPINIKRDEKLSSFIDFYRSFGYNISIHDSGKLETDYEKIAIYMDPNTYLVTHVAKQTESGRWTSKLGTYKDIEHNTLDSLAGSDLGIVTLITKRKVKQ